MFSIQIFYWKWVSGEWLVYSYQEQGFSWLKPHVTDVLFSYKAGWLLYSPMMCLGVWGMIALRRTQPDLFPVMLLFLPAFFYIVSAWDIWWYGGSLGSRAMVQSYAAWLFPMAALIQTALKQRWSRWGLFVFLLFCSWYNFWWTYQAHGDKFFLSEQINSRYFWKVVGRDFDPELYKWLDNPEIYSGKSRKNSRVLYQNDFEQDTVGVSADRPVQGLKSCMLHKEVQFSPDFIVPLKAGEGEWLRTELTFSSKPKETEPWKMCQMIVQFYNGETELKNRMIRLQRHVNGSEQRLIYLDVRIPPPPVTHVKVVF